jgi:catalase-peroxidase
VWTAQEHTPDEMVSRDKRWRGCNGDADYDLFRWRLTSPIANPSCPAAVTWLSSGYNADVHPHVAIINEETGSDCWRPRLRQTRYWCRRAEIGAQPEIVPWADGLAGNNPAGKGNAEDTSTNGIEGSWTPNPTQWITTTPSTVQV